MALAGWFDDLPPWATILAILIGLVVVMTVASMALGVVFAAIAIGVETGSALVSLLAGTLGIAVIVGPHSVRLAAHGIRFGRVSPRSNRRRGNANGDRNIGCLATL